MSADPDCHGACDGADDRNGRSSLRMTPQRQAILDAVRASNDHPRAADIYERVRRVQPGIAFATVYNALHALADHGIILQLSFGDHASRFDARTDRHDHALCTACGDLVDAVAPPSLETIQQAAAETGFSIRAYHTQLLGVCAACQQCAVAETARL
ncbi:MAG: transcriptional repressor [Chloroflexi bacterium]|nr:transcriptional repressor [Chloroflexota bacterium]